jgi:hypothetical protein
VQDVPELLHPTVTAVRASQGLVLYDVANVGACTPCCSIARVADFVGTAFKPVLEPTQPLGCDGDCSPPSRTQVKNVSSYSHTSLPPSESSWCGGDKFTSVKCFRYVARHGTRVSVVLKALCYKPEGHRFESR